MVIKELPIYYVRLTLLESGYDISATQDEKYDMTIAASKGDIRIEEIKSWISDKLINNTQ
jgi:death-on-curing protein